MSGISGGRQMRIGLSNYETNTLLRVCEGNYSLIVINNNKKITIARASTAKECLSNTHLDRKDFTRKEEIIPYNNNRFLHIFPLKDRRDEEGLAWLLLGLDKK